MAGLMMMLGKPKAEAEEEKPGSAREKRLQKAARALIDAIADDDEEGAAEALKASFKCCAAMAEAGEEEPTIYDEE